MTDAHRQPDRAGAPGRGGSWHIDALLLAIAVVLAIAVFLPSTEGEWVYDDERQIVGNLLIQHPSLAGRALLSDVWAFKGGVSSNYWRPTFVAWMIANHRMFGLDPFGWHLSTILLHAATVAFGYLLLRRVGVSRAVTTACAIIFAVHPVHVESVAWISGATDPLLAAFLLASLWCAAEVARRPRHAGWWAASLVLYALALGAKEIAIFGPLLAGAVALAVQRDEAAGRTAWVRAGRIAAAYLALAAAYFIARMLVLRGAIQPSTGGMPLRMVLDSAPGVFVFYLRQIFFPVEIGPSYPLRPVTAATWGFRTFWLPLAISFVVLVGLIRWATASRLGMVAVLLFALPLAPVFNISAFHVEQIVHDRYLYLPLLGMLLVVFGAAETLGRRAGWPRPRLGAVLAAAAAVLCIPLTVQTVRYTRAWTSESLLWRWAVRTDPGSSLIHTQLGVQFYEDGVDLEARGDREAAAEAYAESLAILNRALELNPGLPKPHAMLGRADTLTVLGRFAEAESDVRSMIDYVGPTRDAFERLAIILTAQGRQEEAVATLREGYVLMPGHRANLADQIAVIFVQSGQPTEALRELEAARPAVAEGFDLRSKLVLFHLGLLYQQAGRPEDAREALEEFLIVTARMGDPRAASMRRQAQQALGRLSSGPGIR